MKADDVSRAFVAALEADTALITALGGQESIFRAASSRAATIPSVEWQRITRSEDENRESLVYQFDIWARGYAAAMAIEDRVRVVLDHQHRPTVIGGLLMQAGLEDEQDHPDPEPGVTHTSVDIRFQPAKDET